MLLIQVEKYADKLYENKNKFGGKSMSKQIAKKNVLQPECKNCSRFKIMKAPCSKDACVFRVKTQKPGWVENI